MQSQILHRAVLDHGCSPEVHLGLRLPAHVSIIDVHVFVAKLMLPSPLALGVLLLRLSVYLLELIQNLLLDIEEIHANIVCA